MSTDASATFPVRAQDYGSDVLERLNKGAEVLAIDYAAADEARRALQAEFAAALATVDAIVAPTVPITAPPIGQHTVRLGSHVETVRSALIRLNRPANIAGLPSLTVPCGFDADGMPIGLQLIGRAFDEHRLLQIAQRFFLVRPFPTAAYFTPASAFIAAHSFISSLNRS